MDSSHGLGLALRRHCRGENPEAGRVTGGLFANGTPDEKFVGPYSCVGTSDKQGLPNLGRWHSVIGMAAKTRNISLTPELDRFIAQRVHSGLYGNASDVVRAGMRALAREEVGSNIRRFEEIIASLPQEPLTPEIEQDIVRAVRKSRAAEQRKARR